MDNCRWFSFWRISATATLTNQHFFTLGLPEPDLVDYKGYTQEAPRSTGGVTRHGYKNISLLWNTMDYVQLLTLNNIVNAAVTAGTVYATIDRSFGIKLANDFIDVSGVPHYLTFTPIENSRGIQYSNVTLFVTNITVINDPSDLI